MFGFRKRTTDQDTQIPYQVYETVQEPATRRRRWILRLVLALVVATLLVFSILAIRRGLQNRSGDDGGNVSGQSQQVQQAPQENPDLPQPQGEPAKTPLSDVTNDKTVSQPQ